ncbi:hypothetical protein XM38_045500 [Halomicronema hongdechloris C2206]|uniref:Uncharacterized protein n=1 Tax=Halomicronema hongdechloris C2206 TaxID=1641165 RepID=A0A1Z3HTC1_9CYAN|nr:hypothetical protein XM38_045500 [Halomicronema hongdechloris C2206]
MITLATSGILTLDLGYGSFTKRTEQPSAYYGGLFLAGLSYASQPRPLKLYRLFTWTLHTMDMSPNASD